MNITLFFCLEQHKYTTAGTKFIISISTAALCYKTLIIWDIRDSCHAQEQERRNFWYDLPAGLQQKNRTDDVALARSVNAVMRDKVVMLRAWPDVCASHADSKIIGIFMIMSSAACAAYPVLIFTEVTLLSQSRPSSAFF
jgi:hypothetical protein